MSHFGNRRLADRRQALFGGAALALGGALGGAGLVGCRRVEAPVDEQGRVRLRVASDGPAEARHGGVYAAIASGAYERRGLNIQIVAGDSVGDAAQRLARGTAELGMASDGASLFALAAEGAPVRAVAAFFQRDPAALMVRDVPGLDGLSDLDDRPVLLAQAATSPAWAWLKANAGFTDATLQPFAGDLQPFLDDPTAVLGGLVTSDPYRIQRLGGFEPRTLLLAEEGYPAYGGLVLAPNAFARDNAEALRSFIAATAEGWRDYMRGDPSPADALIRRSNPDLSEPALTAAREALRDNGLVDGGDAALYGLGAMTAERWQAFFDMVSQAGLTPTGLNWRDAFTDNYLPGRG